MIRVEKLACPSHLLDCKLSGPRCNDTGCLYRTKTEELHGVWGVCSMLSLPSFYTCQCISKRCLPLSCLQVGYGPSPSLQPSGLVSRSLLPSKRLQRRSSALVRISQQRRETKRKEQKGWWVVGNMPPEAELDSTPASAQQH